MNRVFLIALVYLLSFGTTLGAMFVVRGPAVAGATAGQQMEAAGQLLVTTDPHATATRTPFQPVGATITPTTTPTPLPPTATPTPTVPVYPLPEGRVNILLLGTDQRSDPGFRTDVIIFVSINPDEGTVSVISFPRDLYVTIPGWMPQRINTAFAHGGFDTMASTFQYNFQIQPQYYFMTNFRVFSDTIDSLNGIAVNASDPLTDKCDLPWASYGYCTVDPGKVTMDGKTALWYVRSRHSTSDFDRLRRGQEVVYAIFRRMMKFDAVYHLPELYEQYQENVQTNMSVTDMLPLLPLATKIMQDPSRIHRYTVTHSMVSDYITPGGAMILLPNYAAINAMIAEAMGGE